MVGGGEDDDGVGFFPFISEVSSSNVVYLLHSSPSSVHFWNSYRIAFFCTYWSTQPVLLLSNKCYARIWMHQIFLGCDFFAAPVSSVSERGFFFLDCTHGVRWNGVPNHCAPRHPDLFLQLTSWHVCSCSVAERQSPCSGGELACFLSPLTLGLQAMVLGVSLSAAVLQDSLP